jgi:hypothetical protein
MEVFGSATIALDDYVPTCDLVYRGLLSVLSYQWSVISGQFFAISDCFAIREAHSGCIEARASVAFFVAGFEFVSNFYPLPRSKSKVRKDF